MENAAERAETAPPGRIEDLLMMVTVIHDVFAQQEIQMVVAVLVDQVVDQIEIIAIKTVDERQSRSMAIAETHHTLRLKRHNPRGQQGQHLSPFRPGCLNRLPSPADPFYLLQLCSGNRPGLPVFPID